MDGMNERWDDEKHNVQAGKTIGGACFLLCKWLTQEYVDTATPKEEMFSQPHMDIADNSRKWDEK